MAANIEEILALLLGEKGLSERPECALLARDPLFVAIVFDKKSAMPRYVLKWTNAAAASHLLKKEFAALKELEIKGDAAFRKTIPCPLALEESHETTVLLESALPGKRMKDIPPETLFGRKSINDTLEKVTAWLFNFYRAAIPEQPSMDEETMSAVFDNQVRSYFDFFRAAPEEKQMIKDALARIKNACGNGFPLCRLHGDFCPENILWGKEQVGVIDFELAFENGAPLDDLFYFLASITGASQKSRKTEERKDVFTEVFFGTGYLAEAAKRAIAEFSKRMGIALPLIPSLFALSWVRYAVRKFTLLTEKLGPSKEDNPLMLWQAIEKRPEEFMPTIRMKNGVCENVRQFWEMKDVFLVI